jgi:transglutaminase-like putative cysteine protease
MIAAVLAALAASFSPSSPQDLVLGPPLVCRVTFEQQVTCESVSGDGRLVELEVRAAIPQNDERQAIEDLAFSPEPERIIQDSHGNCFALWRDATVTPGETLRFQWTCRATLRAVEHRVDRHSQRAAVSAPDAILQRYLGGGRKYGLDDPALIEAARALREGATGALDLAFRTNEFLRKRLTYRNDSRWDDAPQTLRNGHASCSEYNFLFLALCRLNELPARHVGASACRSDEAAYEDTVHHRWSEVWIPGHGWFPVDVSRNDGEDGVPVNQYFGRITDGLLILAKGDGGDGEPLGWGYVSDVQAKVEGDARFSKSKRFLWEKFGDGPPVSSGTGQ